MGSEWSRRRFLKGAGAGTLGLMALGGARLTPAAAGTLSRTRPRGVSGALSADPCDPGNRAKLGVFAEPEGSEVGYFGAFMGSRTKSTRRTTAGAWTSTARTAAGASRSSTRRS